MSGEVTLAEIATAATIFINLSALVWGAAKISAAVGDLRVAVSRLSMSTERLEGMVAGLDKRLTVMEDRHLRKP